MDSSISTSSKKSFLLNLIYKSLKRDKTVARKVAIARRLLQVSNLDEPFLACASLYTISEANKNSEAKNDTASRKSEEAEQSEEKLPSTNQSKPKSESYDVGVRNPLYSNADRENLWEFSLLSKNFHPSVNEFVSSLLVGGEVTYDGDPFNDFTRIKFLDKFVFKNPKKGVKASNKKFYMRNQVQLNQPQVYSSEFRGQKESKVNADERFFFDYFKAQKTCSSQPAEQKDTKQEEDNDLDLDFADDIKFASTALTKAEKKSKKKEDTDDDDVSESGSEFSYGDMPEEEDDTADQLNDKAYEKFLWENLNSDGESLQGSDDEGQMEEDGWEDLEVAASDEEIMEDNDGEGDGNGDFLVADDLDNIIMKHSKKKRKADTKKEDGSKRKKTKKSGKNKPKSKKNKFKQ